MKPCFLFFAFSLVSLCSCGFDPEDSFQPMLETYETDEHIEAPIVSCEDAFDAFELSFGTAPTSQRIVGIDFSPSGEGIAIDRDENVWRIADNGETWSIQEADFPEGQIQSPYFAGEQTIYATLYRGINNVKLVKSSDGGQTYQLLAGVGLEPTDIVQDMYFLDEVTGYAIVFDYQDLIMPVSKLLKTENGGQSWLVMELPGEGSLVKFSTIEGQMAIVRHADVLVQQPAGWDLRPFPVSPEAYFPRSKFSASRGLLINGEGALYRTEDGGRSWLLDEEGFNWVSFIHITDDNTELMIGERYRVSEGDLLELNGLLIYERLESATSWEIEKTSVDCELFPILAVLPTGRILGISQQLSFLDR